MNAHPHAHASAHTLAPARCLAETESVCPVCLQRLAAQRVAEGDEVYLVKECPDHGRFKTVVWRGLASYRAWGAQGSRAARPPVCETGAQRGCPYDCGLCPEHRQHTCCVLLEVTQRCNLRCPVCFAAAAEAGSDPTLDQIEAWLRTLLAHGSRVNIQLSGGEPTVRDDLPEIIALARALGFDFVQLNTNGIRLAKDADYAERLAQAGLDCVFLQFDGVSDAVYQHIRGARLLQLKKTAITRCGDAGLGVILVPTLVPGINTSELGAIIDFALARVPTVRAVHFQPISYFGRYPASPADTDRITLPEIMGRIEAQTGGMVRATDFNPGSAENAYCSFSGKFFVGGDGRLQRASEPIADQPADHIADCTTGHTADRAAGPATAAACCGDDRASSPCGCGVPARGADVLRARRFVATHWIAQKRQDPHANAAAQCCGGDVASFDAFLAARRHSFCISGMAFQDAWTLDLERLRECYIHVVSPDRRVVPFCAYNLTSMSGASLYRPQARDQACAGA